MKTKEKDENAKNQAKAQLESIVEMVTALEGAILVDDEDAIEEGRNEIQSDPLSVEIRNGWHTVGSVAIPEEFCILLCWGGPACRIIGELDEHAQPYNPKIQYQDWFNGWTDYVIKSEYDQKALQTYCEQFYFEE